MTFSLSFLFLFKVKRGARLLSCAMCNSVWVKLWLDADFGRGPNSGCTLHQWEHLFQQSVPHMAPRPLLHAPSRQRVSFMLPDSGSLRASWPSDQLFWSDLAPRQREDFYVKDYFFSLDCLRSWVLWAGDRLRSPEICAWTILAVRGGIYLSPSFKP